MKLKFAFLFMLIAVIGCPVANAAVAVKKAAPVATKKAGVTDSATSLVGNVLGVVSMVQQLNAQQKALTEECVPKSAEISFVDKTLQEWAMTGAKSAEEVANSLKMKPCGANDTYEASVKFAETAEMPDEVCFNVYTEDMVWKGYPKVGVARICPGGDDTCKNQKTVSNIYEIFNLIDFSQTDYTPQEVTLAGKLMDKIESCSNAKLSAKKRAMWGEFLTNTLSTVGQKTDTANIMQQVSQISSSGGGLGSLSGLGSMAAQYLQ